MISLFDLYISMIRWRDRQQRYWACRQAQIELSRSRKTNKERSCSSSGKKKNDIMLLRTCTRRLVSDFGEAQNVFARRVYVTVPHAERETTIRILIDTRRLYGTYFSRACMFLYNARITVLPARKCFETKASTRHVFTHSHTRYCHVFLRVKISNYCKITTMMTLRLHYRCRHRWTRSSHFIVHTFVDRRLSTMT